MKITCLRTAGQLVLMAILTVTGTRAFAAQPQTFTDNFTQTYTITCPYGDLNASMAVSDQGFLFLEATDEATRLKIVLSASKIITNSLNAKTATGEQHATQTLYQKNADWVTTGVDMSINVPGVAVCCRLPVKWSPTSVATYFMQHRCLARQVSLRCATRCNSDSELSRQRNQ